MKKIIFMPVLALFIQNGLLAQNYKVFYEREVKQDVGNQLDQITDPVMRKQIEAQLANVDVLELLHKGNVSTFAKQKVDESKADNSLKLEEEPSSQLKVIRMGDEGKSAVLYKDLVNKIYLKSTSLMGKAFMIKDTLPNYNWDLLNETKTVGNYVCRKAITVYNNKKIEAWYAPSIPLKDGPEDYYGLPGLIVELTDGNTTYNALSVKEISDLSIVKPSEGKKVTRDEYQKLLEERVDALKQQYKNE
jgi:GLPGLI family protein